MASTFTSWAISWTLHQDPELSVLERLAKTLPGPTRLHCSHADVTHFPEELACKALSRPHCLLSARFAFFFKWDSYVMEPGLSNSQ